MVRAPSLYLGGSWFESRHAHMMSKVHFLKAALKDYKVAAVTPSSSFVVKRILKSLPRSCAYMVEYGAGDGVITKALLEELPKDGKLVAIEMNPHFIQNLKKIRDPRLQVVQADVLKVCKDFSKFKLPRVDAVISGIPFSFFNAAERTFIAKQTFHKLGEHGKFILYQFSPLMLPYLKSFFKKRVRLSLEVRNFPPYFIIVAEK